MRQGRLCLPLSQTGCLFPFGGLAAAATPNVVGNIHCTVSCNSIVYWHGVARIKHRGLAVGSSRKDAHAGTLPVDIYKKTSWGLSALSCAIGLSSIVSILEVSLCPLNHRDLDHLLGHRQGLRL